MVATASAFDSLTGRRGVDIGTSFTRAWNERTGKTTKRSKDYPNPEYYSLRYNFKPESIDNEATGSLTPKGGDGHVFELERPSSQQHGDSYRFTAVEQPSKEWECVLLWDPATQQLTLEKLESTLNLNYDGRGRGTLRKSSTTPPSSVTATTGPNRTRRSSHVSRDRTLEDDLEKALTGNSDAEGEVEDDIDVQAELEAIAGVSSRREEEEEEEEEDEEMVPVDVEPSPPVKPLKVPPHKAPPPPKAAAPTKLKSKARVPARPSSGGGTKREREVVVDGIEEEELTFGEPTRKRTRHARRSSAANNNNNGGYNHNSHASTSSSSGLALPMVAAHTQARHAPPTPSDLLQPPSSMKHSISYAGSSETGTDSEDDEESDEGGEVDEAALERELELELELENGMEADEDEEGLMEAIPIENNGQHNTGRPLSLNELFGEQSQADDDTTSDDSDDD